ncbi:MAG: hypothetical protein EZS28_046276 [Streblomastix strix]|uniref:Uncharacterized protein n=1 Tax=Streblomastix strix TaxID=222440 RepID=A0A5J4TIE3_9EUKA|nr:MAG: hypothetical protein EZS28_046276 [Streblomastix strix]
MKQQCIIIILLQQLDVEQSPWTIVQLDVLSGTTRERPRPVIHKIEIEITHQWKAKDNPSNVNNPQSQITPYPNQN